MTVDERELEDILKSFDELGESISDPRFRRKAMLKAAQIVKRASQTFVKDSDKPHKRYSTPKIVKRRRAKKGSGVVAATYYPGNLRLSIKRLPFRKTFRQFIGPSIYKRKRVERKGMEIGRNAKTAIGYYAAMSRGKASTGDKFRREVMEAGLRSSAGRARQAARQEVEKQIRKEKRKTGL